MVCALSDSMPLAIVGTEVLDSMVRGGLAAPNDVAFSLISAYISGLQRLSLSRRVRLHESVRLPLGLEHML